MASIRRPISLTDIERVGTSLHEPQRHREIVAIVQEELDEAKERSDPHNRKPAPLFHIVYALCNFAFPDFAVEQASNFLDLLASLEAIRQVNLQKTEDVFPHIFKDEASIKRSGLLEQDIDDRLIRYTHEMTGLREAYWIIVVACCTQHLTYLGTKPSLTDFWLHFQDYFPFLVDAGPSSSKIHLGMSEVEQDTLRKAAETCISDVIAAKQEGVVPSELMHHASDMIRHYVKTVCAQNVALEEAIGSLGSRNHPLIKC